MESPSSSREATHSSTLGNRASAPYKLTKLKASCSFCALSNGKCDCSQPQCTRCIKNAAFHSEARRIGRARQTYAAQSREKQELIQDRKTENSQDRSTSPPCSTALRDRLSSTSPSTSSLSLPPSNVFQDPSSHADPLQPTCLKNDTGFLPTPFGDLFDAPYCMDSQCLIDTIRRTLAPTSSRRRRPSARCLVSSTPVVSRP